MTRCADPSLFAGIASVLSASAGGRFRLIIGYESEDGAALAREGASIVEGNGGHALLMPRALPAPVTAFSVRMVMADGAVYVTADGEALIYLGGRAVDRSREGAPASETDLARIDEAVAAFADVAAITRADGGWEWVGDGMIGAYVDRAASRIASLAQGSSAPAGVHVDEASGLLASVLERVGIPVVEAEAGLSLRVPTDGRTLVTSLPAEQVRAVLADAASTNPAIPSGTGMYCVDPAFVMDADAISAGAALAALTAR
ncbi:phosphomannomutase [Actinomyces sp.]|uniref:phosphomannomutase n=1 Tax=Actinomyces sp. TaxID=29317 RepID=UPI0025BC9DD3|nr:phosphomannomutase [Actinomyces sp.]